jgi:hypothetical protein
LDMSCQWFPCWQSVLIPYTYKEEHFSKWVTKLNCCGCSPALRMPWIT